MIVKIIHPINNKDNNQIETIPLKIKKEKRSNNTAKMIFIRLKLNTILLR